MNDQMVDEDQRQVMQIMTSKINHQMVDEDLRRSVHVK